ncbi:hypothetical protein [Halobacillus karajensis]|uniref:hypothetical protein n=1 Tax=Halobacillus karajensis TaxID=195088 RepID=UPI00045D2C0B|nr:hypothetical protein [Halobacillus karajensis]CDQ21674.1 hypothetical protein BN982_04083 [Halobacillus karajensis]
MTIKEVTEASKKRAEELAEKHGGFIVPVYSVVKTDEEDKVMRVIHDHLDYIDEITKDSGDV